MNFAEPITITELNSEIKELIETNFTFVYVLGEISNFKKHLPSGHYYFVLKDSDSQISSVMWKSRNVNLGFVPEDGLKVIVKGKVTLYSSQGRYQIDVFDIQKAGFGEMQLALEKLKEKLKKEGLFDEKNKISVEDFPRFPEKVAIITSESGAVINDFKKVAAGRYPLTRIFLIPVNVQGAGASEEICKALKYANNPELELEIIVVARGGGSVEDLFVFNDEKVARAVFASEIPVVSAIGHEVDFTICDFVADVRAATPSAAAEIIFPDSSEIEKDLSDAYFEIKDIIAKRLTSIGSDLDNISNNFHFNKPLNILNECKMKLDNYQKSFENAIGNKLFKYKYGLDNLENILLNISPEKTLKRGYTYILKNNKLIKRKAGLDSGDVVEINFFDGSKKAKIDENS